jgi:cytoskeleton protein RodZ
MATAVRFTRETGLPSFGEKLRREREKRSITLEQISLSTKIGTRMLQALENDRFNQLPGGIFNKGFVRAYARHLGLDEDQTVAEYLEASGDAPPVQPELLAEESVRIVEAGSDVPSRQLPWGLFAAILLLAALALSIWSHRQKKHEGTAPPPSAPPAAQQPVEDRDAQPPTPPNPALSSTNDRNLVTPSPINPTAQAIPAALNPAPPSPALPLPGAFEVVVQAREDSWTAIQVDGRTVYSGILSPGEQRAVRGRKEVIVKAGNVGGIDLNFNGKKLDRLGDDGQVRTLTFGPGGMEASTPTAPPAR